MLTQSQIDFFNENGFLRLEQVYSPAEIGPMTDELGTIMKTHANWEPGWRGAWRKEYMNEAEDKKSLLVHIHELHHYSAAWNHAIAKPELAEAVSELLPSDCVEVHHSTLHAKGPEAGTPFPMHQDDPFYPHEDGRYIDCLVHVDNADEESGCLKFLAGSYKLGKLEHIRGPEIEPYLPTDKYRIQDAVSVPAKSGDVILFHIYTIHGSALNRSGRWRRLVRVGMRDPRNRQIGGQAISRPGIIVKGIRPKVEGVTVDVYGLWNPQPEPVR